MSYDYILDFESKSNILWIVVSQWWICEPITDVERSDHILNEPITDVKRSDHILNEPITDVERSDHILNEPITDVERSDHTLNEQVVQLKMFIPQTLTQDGTLTKQPYS